MLEREAFAAQVVGVADVDDRVLVRLGVRIGLVGDYVNRRRLRRGPAGQHPRSLERVAGQRPEPEHSCASSSWSSLTASVHPPGPGGRPAVAAARMNSSVALATASSWLPACTISRAPYWLVPMPLAPPPLAATASASSTTCSRVITWPASALIPTLHLTGHSSLVFPVSKALARAAGPLACTGDCD